MMTDFRSQKEAPVEVRTSEAVPGQKGLFALKSIFEGELLGCYQGEVVLNVSDDATDPIVCHFRIAEGKLGSRVEICADP